MWYRGFWNRRGFWDYGSRYGWDKLSIILISLSVVLFMWKYTFITGLVIGGYAIWRVLSKDIEKRRYEQTVFENWMRRLGNRLNILYHKLRMNKLGKKITGFFTSIKQRKYYLIIKCPRCSQKLRLPRHKGQLIVTCKSCNFKFKKRT